MTANAAAPATNSAGHSQARRTTMTVHSREPDGRPLERLRNEKGSSKVAAPLEAIAYPTGTLDTLTPGLGFETHALLSWITMMVALPSKIASEHVRGRTQERCHMRDTPSNAPRRVPAATAPQAAMRIVRRALKVPVPTRETLGKSPRHAAGRSGG